MLERFPQTFHLAAPKADPEHFIVLYLLSGWACFFVEHMVDDHVCVFSHGSPRLLLSTRIILDSQCLFVLRVRIYYLRAFRLDPEDAHRRREWRLSL